MKRIARHMEQAGYRRMDEYIQALKEHNLLRLQCDRLMTVSISRFFRDRALWQTLEDVILPFLVKKRIAPVKAWSAGCACGEEIYSLKIIWDLFSRRMDAVPNLEILATDMNPIYLDKAKAGIYPQSSLKEIPEWHRCLFFCKPDDGSKHWAISPTFSKNIRWREENFLHCVPDEQFHLIFMRNNLLTYYDAGHIADRFQKVIDCLQPQGYLIVGAHEIIPSIPHRLKRLKEHPCIYQQS